MNAAAAGDMRAAVVQAPGRAGVQRVPRPDPGPGAVRVRLDGCGVCGSNLAVWRGQPWFQYPQPAGAPGHEGWGTVDAVGDGVEAVRAGDRVALLSSHAFAEYDLAPADHVVVLPAALDGQPFPGEALACAVNVVRRAGIAPGDVVVVVGVGFLGALVIKQAAACGAVVVAVSRRGFARDVAMLQGAVAAVALEDHDRTVAAVIAACDGQPCGVAIEAAGTQTALDVASAVVGVRGRLVIAGYHQDGPRQVDMQSWNWRGLDVVNAHERDAGVYLAGVRAAAAAVSAGDWDLAPLFTHRVELGAVGEALSMLDARPDGFLKALVLP